MEKKIHVGKAVRKTSYPVRILFAFLVAIPVFVIGLYIQRTSVTVYTGTLPCADCVGIKTKLTLNENGMYELQSLYIDRGNPFTEKGTWQEIQKNNMHVYALSHDKTISYYQILSSSTLKMLDMSGRPINAPFNMELKKQ